MSALPDMACVLYRRVHARPGDRLYLVLVASLPMSTSTYKAPSRIPSPWRVFLSACQATYNAGAATRLALHRLLNR